jgi:hypothetical protein
MYRCYQRIGATITEAGAGASRINWRHTDTFTWRAILADLRDRFDCQFEPARKCWFVYAPADVVYDWALERFSAGQIDYEPARGYQREQHQAHQADQRERRLDAAYAALHLQPTAPDELVASAHRVMARLTHPDIGGSHAQMVEINNAYDAIVEARR